MAQCPKLQKLRQDCFLYNFLDVSELRSLPPTTIHKFLKSTVIRTLEYTDEIPMLFFNNPLNVPIPSIPGDDPDNHSEADEQSRAHDRSGVG